MYEGAEGVELSEKGFRHVRRRLHFACAAVFRRESAGQSQTVMGKAQGGALREGDGIG